MHGFGVSLRLGIKVFMVSTVKQSIWKGFRSMEPDLESFGFMIEEFDLESLKKKYYSVS